jgi:hypothetical protein
MRRIDERKIPTGTQWEGAAIVIDEAEVALATMRTLVDDKVVAWVKVSDVESMLDRLANQYVPDHQFHR